VHRAFKGKGGGESGDDEEGRLRLVYVTPERVSKSKQLMAALEAADARRALTRFVVDEAHCCSQWGFDFRSDYAQVGEGAFEEKGGGGPVARRVT
jgi:superfamily II DNA helicase RecQ